MRRIHFQTRFVETRERLRVVQTERNRLQEEVNQDLPVNIQTLQEELKVLLNRQ